jgi:hypothetical protein
MIEVCDLTVFELRPFVVITLPLSPSANILRTEQIIINVDRSRVDFGAFCYIHRSDECRAPGQPRRVALASFRSERPKQIAQAINVLSSMLTDGAARPRTVATSAHHFKRFLDWADATGHHDCLSGGTATVTAYRGWAAQVAERFRRHEILAHSGHVAQSVVCAFLEQVTGQIELSRGIRVIPAKSGSKGTEPAAEQHFGRMLALNQSLFDGLCDLVLTNQKFPYKLNLPKSLGWKDSFLWCFPGAIWNLPPHLWELGSENTKMYQAYDYRNGRIFEGHEIQHLYRRAIPSSTERAIVRAASGVAKANADTHHRVRLNLAMIAQTAFFFLFLSNTGCNLAVARDIQTDGEIVASAVNQNYRTMKFRAQGKVVTVVLPVSFMPTLRRFLELRKYLLTDVSCPYLFFTLGDRIDELSPGQISVAILEKNYNILRRISPSLPRISTRKIRATVNDYYRRAYDKSITAKVLGRSEVATDQHYVAGSPFDHEVEMTLLLEAVSVKARSQKIVPARQRLNDAKALEEGGRCSSYGNPMRISDDMPPPDCRQGCIFCVNRVLVANEEDARKVASAAFIMEQLILGPVSEAEFRPQIEKCDEDLTKISDFDGCAAMVQRVRKDVYENGNLTPYFADKFQMFLELGVLS